MKKFIIGLMMLLPVVTFADIDFVSFTLNPDVVEQGGTTTAVLVVSRTPNNPGSVNDWKSYRLQMASNNYLECENVNHTIGSSTDTETYVLTATTTIGNNYPVHADIYRDSNCQNKRDSAWAYLDVIATTPSATTTPPTSTTTPPTSTTTPPTSTTTPPVESPTRSEPPASPHPGGHRHCGTPFTPTCEAYHGYYGTTTASTTDLLALRIKLLDLMKQLLVLLQLKLSLMPQDAGTPFIYPANNPDAKM